MITSLRSYISLGLTLNCWCRTHLIYRTFSSYLTGSYLTTGSICNVIGILCNTFSYISRILCDTFSYITWILCDTFSYITRILCDTFSYITRIL